MCQYLIKSKKGFGSSKKDISLLSNILHCNVVMLLVTDLNVSCWNDKQYVAAL